MKGARQSQKSFKACLKRVMKTSYSTLNIKKEMEQSVDFHLITKSYRYSKKE
jgi:hypothetical protein